MSNKIIATIARSAGNESVGEMWHETAIFHEQSRLADVMLWMSERVGKYPTLTSEVVLTFAQETVD
jgi:hypothetical protein